MFINMMQDGAQENEVWKQAAALQTRSKGPGQDYGNSMLLTILFPSTFQI